MDELELEYSQKMAKETGVIRKYLTEYHKDNNIDPTRDHYVWKDLLDESKLTEDPVKRKYPNVNNSLTEEELPKKN
jgi:hypothetical protein